MANKDKGGRESRKPKKSAKAKPVATALPRPATVPVVGHDREKSER